MFDWHHFWLISCFLSVTVGVAFEFVGFSLVVRSVHLYCCSIVGLLCLSLLVCCGKGLCWCLWHLLFLMLESLAGCLGGFCVLVNKAALGKYWWWFVALCGCLIHIRKWSVIHFGGLVSVVEFWCFVAEFLITAGYRLAKLPLGWTVFYVDAASPYGNLFTLCVLRPDSAPVT